MRKKRMSIYRLQPRSKPSKEEQDNMVPAKEETNSRT